LAHHEVRSEARHVARREASRTPETLDSEVVGLRLTPAIEVPHAERTRQIALERVANVLPRQRFERRASSVEVPVLVLEVLAPPLLSFRVPEFLS
jgi:hypothetical protein